MHSNCENLINLSTPWCSCWLIIAISTNLCCLCLLKSCLTKHVQWPSIWNWDGNTLISDWYGIYIYHTLIRDWFGITPCYGTDMVSLPDMRLIWYHTLIWDWYGITPWYVSDKVSHPDTRVIWYHILIWDWYGITPWYESDKVSLPDTRLNIRQHHVSQGGLCIDTT